jgi:hypothetical protein
MAKIRQFVVTFSTQVDYKGRSAKLETVRRQAERTLERQLHYAFLNQAGRPLYPLFDASIREVTRDAVKGGGKR